MVKEPEVGSLYAAEEVLHLSQAARRLAVVHLGF